MSHDTEKLIKILQGSESPTDMALIIVANKIDDLKEDLAKLTIQTEERLATLATETDEKFEALKRDTKSARWIHTHRRPMAFVLTILFILSSFGVKALIEFIKTKLGM